MIRRTNKKRESPAGLLDKRDNLAVMVGILTKRGKGNARLPFLQEITRLLCRLLNDRFEQPNHSSATIWTTEPS